MTTITHSTHGSNLVIENYREIFKSRNEIGTPLTFEQMLDVVSRDTRELSMNMFLSQEFNFYLQKLFLVSWTKIVQKSNPEEKKELFLFLKKESIQNDSFLIKTLALLIQLTFFPETLSEAELRAIFNGDMTKDVHCMHLAYNTMLARTNKGGVDFDVS